MFLGEVGRGGRGRVDGGRKRLSQSSLLIQKGERNATAQTLLSQKIIFFLNLEDLGFLEKKINFFYFCHVSQMWQHLTDQWMENVTDVLF